MKKLIWLICFCLILVQGVYAKVDYYFLVELVDKNQEIFEQLVTRGIVNTEQTELKRESKYFYHLLKLGNGQGVTLFRLQTIELYTYFYFLLEEKNWDLGDDLYLFEKKLKRDILYTISYINNFQREIPILLDETDDPLWAKFLTDTQTAYENLVEGLQKFVPLNYEDN